MPYKEKLPLSSKKFLAFFFSMLMITGIMIVALVLQPITWPMATFMAAGMISNGALSIGYVINQTALDKFMAGIAKVASKQKEENEESDAEG
jgi:hypothetical protein